MQKKVLFLITKSNWGGAQRYVFDLATNLPKDKFTTIVACGGNGILIDKLQAENIKTIPLKSLQRDISIFKEIQALQETARIIKNENPDILHINSSKAGLFGAALGRFYKVPKIIFTSHGWSFNEKRPFWQRMILKYLHWLTVLLSHETIAVSHEVKNQMNWPFVQQKIIVIHNGINRPNFLNKLEAREFFTGQTNNLKPYLNDFWTMTIGELHPIKRHEAVIRVVNSLAKEGVKIRHLIIGSGELEEKLKKLTAKFGLKNHVFFLGQIVEASKYIKASDAFILSSRSEAMPYVIVESIMSGTPTIATAVGGIPEVIENGINGILTQPENNKELLEAIKKIQNNKELGKKMGENAEKRSGQFTLEKMLGKTIFLYIK